MLSEADKADDPDTDVERSRDPNEDTAVEAPYAKRETERPTGSVGTSRASTFGEHPSLSLDTLRHTMRHQDAERTRGFVIVAAGVCVAVSLPLAFVGGHPLLKGLFGVSMLLTAASFLWLWYRLRDGTSYQLGSVVRVGYVSITGAFFGIAFFGFFSPAPVVIPFGLYFFGLAHSFRGTMLIYALCAGVYAGIAVPIGLGYLPDLGLIRHPPLGTFHTIFVVAAVEVVFFATYAIARLSRRATVNAIAAHDKAVRQVAGRDALLHEARMDLDGVLRARGLGRFTEETVGSYRLGEILGRGGMGEVYEARHIDSEEEAAVKMLHSHVLGDDAAVRRFARECEIIGRLDVANVVKVLETSKPDDPIPYIAMERLRGSDLSEHLRAHSKMRMRDVLRMIRQVGRGLDAAREAQVVHRDLKPRNLFLAQTGEEAPQWKILDFGVSKLTGDATLTQANLVGTPSYMAPEQAEAAEVTHRTDLYSLGVICYRCLTGRPPFGGESPASILYQVVNEMPPAASDLDPRLDPDVDLVLGIAVAKDPYDRFDSATELADMLEKAARGRLPIAVRERARRVLSKHPWTA